MEEKNSWFTKNKSCCIIGIILIICALSLSVGGVIAYSHMSKSLISLNTQHGITQVLNENDAINYFQMHYILGTEESNKYKIKYNDKPEDAIAHRYAIDGLFTNETEEHFATIELNFSLLDKQGNKIGDAYASCDGLNSKQTWNFTAITQGVLETDIVAEKAVLDDIRIAY